MNFAVLEEGRLTLDEYLYRVVFNEKRPFVRREFRAFMFVNPSLIPKCSRSSRGSNANMD